MEDKADFSGLRGMTRFLPEGEGPVISNTDVHSIQFLVDHSNKLAPSMLL